MRVVEAGEDRRVRVVLHADDRRLERHVAGRCRARRVEGGVGGRVHEGVDHDAVALLESGWSMRFCAAATAWSALAFWSWAVASCERTSVETANT